MTSINLIVNGSKARAEVDGILTSGSIGIPVTIQYDSSWDGLTKHLVCTNGKWGPTGKPRTMLNVETASTVAHEVMIADDHLYLGVEGRNAEGNLVIHTMWADCGTIFPGANAGADLSTMPTMPIWAQLQAQINDLKKNTGSIQDAEHGSSNTAVLTSTQTAALDGLFKVCAFTKADISTEYNEFMSAFGLTDSGVSSGSENSGGDDSGDSGETVTTYTVTNILTNVTTDSTVTEVTEGGSYRATVTVEDGYMLSSLVITMDGVDITDTVYGEGYILIPEVTGDVVITAVAEEPIEIPMWTFTSVTKMNAYSDDGATLLQTLNYRNGYTSYNATETDAEVLITISNNTDSSITSTIYFGSGAVTSMKYAESKSVALAAGKSATYNYVVRAGNVLTVCDGDNTNLAVGVFGKLDIYQPTAEYPVATKQVTTTKVYSDGTTDTQLHSANYQYVVYTTETFAEDTDLIVSLVGGENNVLFTGTDWYFGSVDPTALATVYYGVRKGGSNAQVLAGQVQKYTYTVKAGYAFAITYVMVDLKTSMVYVEKA